MRHAEGSGGRESRAPQGRPREESTVPGHGSLDIDLQGKLDRRELLQVVVMRSQKKKACAPVRSMSARRPLGRSLSEFTSRQTARIDDRYTSRSYLTGVVRETDLRTDATSRFARGFARYAMIRGKICETTFSQI